MLLFFIVEQNRNRIFQDYQVDMHADIKSFVLCPLLLLFFSVFSLFSLIVRENGKILLFFIKKKSALLFVSGVRTILCFVVNVLESKVLLAKKSNVEDIKVTGNCLCCVCLNERIL